MTRPNIVFLTTGSANSTVIVRMLAALGWNLGPADEQYAEHQDAVLLNQGNINGKPFDHAKARQILRDLSQPWIIKDPRMSHTLRHWLPLLEPYRPLLLWITKDIDYVRDSFQRRFKMNPELANKRQAWCQTYFDKWPYAKLKLDVAHINAAVALYDVKRSSGV